jgi:hypothetical protein
MRLDQDRIDAAAASSLFRSLPFGALVVFLQIAAIIGVIQIIRMIVD